MPPTKEQVPLTRLEMDRMKCEHCDEELGTADHGVLCLEPRCHPKQGVDVEYHQGGTMHVFCHVCRKPVGVFAVAPNHSLD